MFRYKIDRGFTMIELLVTLVIMGLMLALVTPNVMTWLSSRERAAEIKKLDAYTQILPLKARASGQAITIEQSSQLQQLNFITVVEPIVVLRNGFCKGGQVVYDDGRIQTRFMISTPFCRIVRVNAT